MMQESKTRQTWKEFVIKEQTLKTMINRRQSLQYTNNYFTSGDDDG